MKAHSCVFYHVCVCSVVIPPCCACFRPPGGFNRETIEALQSLLSRDRKCVLYSSGFVYSFYFLYVTCLPKDNDCVYALGVSVDIELKMEWQGCRKV